MIGCEYFFKNFFYTFLIEFVNLMKREKLNFMSLNLHTTSHNWCMSTMAAVGHDCKLTETVRGFFHFKCIWRLSCSLAAQFSEALRVRLQVSDFFLVKLIILSILARFFAKKSVKLKNGCIFYSWKSICFKCIENTVFISYRISFCDRVAKASIFNCVVHIEFESKKRTRD